MWHLTRRTLLAGAAVMAGDAALAQSAPPPRAKGPLVWLDMDQKELDDAYDQSVYAPNRAGAPAATCQQRAVRARLGEPQRLAYGSSRSRSSISTRPRGRTRRSMSSFTAAPGARALAKDYAFLAEMFINAGAHYVVARLQQRGSKPTAT